MEIIVQTINTAGRAFVDFALPMLMQSSLLIAILLAVDVVLRRKVRAVFRYWIWMLVLVKLVLPPSLGSPVSLGTWLGGALQAPTAALREAGPPLPEATPLAMSLARVAHTSSPSVPTPVVPPPPSTDMMAPYRSAPAQAAPVEASPQPTSRLPAPAVLPPGPSVTWQGLVLLAWGVTVAALLLLLVQRMFFVRGLVAQAEEGNPGMRDALAECRARLGLHSRVAVRLSPNAASPAVCGLVRPVILVPQNLGSRLHGADLQAVLLHELAHVQRGDLWINLAQTLLQIAYFYHPLLWLANAVIRGAREQAVDETVLVALGDTAPRYPETLVNIAKLAFRRRPALSLRLIGVVESKSALTARIKHMLARPIPKTARLGAVGLAAIALLAVILLPMAKGSVFSRDAVTDQVMVVRWMAVLRDDSATQVLAEARALASKSKSYQAVQLDANDLLSTVRNCRKNDQMLCLIEDLKWVEPSPKSLHADSWARSTNLRRSIYSQFSTGGAGPYKLAVDGAAAKFDLRYEFVSCSLNPGVRTEGSIFFKGSLPVGQALVLAAPMREGEETVATHLVVWQVVPATGDAVARANAIRSAARWIEVGPSLLTMPAPELAAALEEQEEGPPNGFRSIVLPTCEVPLSDVNGQNVPVLDLINGQVRTLPRIKGQDEFLEMIERMGCGEMVYYYDRATSTGHISFLRDTIPAWLTDNRVTGFRVATVPIPPTKMPVETTITTRSGEKFTVIITRMDKDACYIDFSRFGEAGGVSDAISPRSSRTVGPVAGDASRDSDGDGLSDFQEVHKYLTDPTKADSDGDGTPDGDWNERREYTYSVRTVLRYMPPFDEKGLNDDFQDARVLKQTAQYIEVEVIHYPLATSSDSTPENRNWRQDDAGDARLAEYLAPGATTNWDEQMREDLLAALRADGIDVETLTDKQVVERVSSWLLRRSRSLDKVFTTYYVDFPEGRPRVYPGLEDAFRHEFERDSVHYDWTIDQHFDHELLGKGMFYNRTHGSCTSTAIYLTTVLRALGIPTRIVLATPAVDASDRAQILMVKNAITHHRVRETMLAGLRRSRSGWTNHTFNEVYLGNRWCRLDYSQLGCPILGVDRFGLQTHLYTLRDLSDANFAPTWGRRYARGWRDEFFEHDNPYSAVEVSDLFGAHANIPNPPFTAEDLHVPSNPRPNIFLFYPEQADVWSAVMEVVKDNVWDRTGRAHAREFYENLFEGVWTTKPGDILVLLFSLDTSERVPAGYEDLLPKPWPEIEAQLQQGETVELGGKARDKNVIVLAAPTARELKPLVQNSKLLQAIGGPGAAPAVSPTQPPAVLPPAGQSVKQADGVTAELLGVCTHPSEGKQWWRPDGSPLEPAPYKTTGATEVPQAGLQWYEFALRLPAPADAHVRWVVAGSERGSDSGPPLGSDGEPCRDLRAYKAALPEGKESTDIRLGVATGAWQTRALHDIPRSEGSYPLDEGRAVAFGAAYEKDGCTYLPVTTNFSGDLADYEVVAVDGEGTIHRAAGWYGGGNVLLSMTCRFDLPLARVKEFRLQMRPWTWLEFKNVSLCPRQDKGSEPGASGPTKGVRGASSVKMVATLAGGVTLELLGVCEHPSAGKQWWQPDGSPLDAPYKTTGSKLEPQAGRKDYEFVARYGGAPDIDLAWDVPGSGRASYTGNPLDESGRPVPDLAVYTVQFPEDQAMTKVRIGVAAGQWQTRATHTSPDREGTYAVDGKAVAFGIAYAKDGSTFLPVTTDLFHRDVAFRVVAIRQQGEVCSGGLSGAGGAKLNSLTYRLHCPLSDVKEFQFQTRPWTWLEFPNVALRPAQK